MRKDYRLGPRLIAVGEAAREQYPVVEFARDELRRLSEDVGTECVASAPIGDEMVIVDRAGPVRPDRPDRRRRLPLPARAADGDDLHGLVLPGGDRRVAAPGRRPTSTEAELDRYRLAWPTVRERGWSGRAGTATSTSCSTCGAPRTTG